MTRTFEIVRLVAILSLGVILAVSQSAVSSTDDPSKSPERHVAELVAMEMLRLGTFPDETLVGISRTSAFGKKIVGSQDEKKKDAPTEITLTELQKFLAKRENRKNLSEEEYKKLLGLLRLANATLRGKDVKTALKDLISQELKQLTKAVPGGGIKISDSLREKLKDDFKEIIGSEIPEVVSAKDLQKVLEEKGFERLSDSEKTSLLGEARVQAYDQKGDARIADFDTDLREDMRGRLRNAGIAETDINRLVPSVPNGANPIQRRFEDYLPKQKSPESAALDNPSLSQPNQQDQSLPNGNDPASSSGAGPASGARPSPRQSGHSPQRDFPSFGGAGRPGRGTGVAPRRVSVGAGGSSSSIPVPDGLFTDKAALDTNDPNEKALLRRLKTEKTSLLVTIDGNAACQLTLHKATPTGNGTCKFIASSAKHCFSNSRPLLSIEGFSDSDISQGDSVVRPSESGGDLAAVHFTANRNCDAYSALPKFDVASSDTFSNLEGKGIILASRWGASSGIFNLGGRVSNTIPSGLDSASGSVLQIDLRDRANGGMGVFPGDSGGGTFISVTDASGNEKLQLLGVLYKKIEGAEYDNGIGFIASRSDTDWLAREIGAGTSRNTELARHDSSGGRASQTQTHFDSIN